MRISEKLLARGHPNITARHPTTFEVTKGSELTKRGDCIIAVRATKGPRELSPEFKAICKNDASRILVELRAAGISDIIEGWGSRRLILSHASEIVGRKSSFISDRTLMIRADKAACDIDRDLVEALRSPRTTVTVRMTAEL